MKQVPLEIFDRLDKKLMQLNALRPIPKAALKNLQERFSLEMTYNSNAIEGNTLTLKETFWVLNEGITIKGKSLKDHLEVKDHSDALEFLYEMIEKGSHITFSENIIRNIHALVVKRSEEEMAGKYRTSNVFITGSGHTPPDSFEVPFEMQKLVTWIKENKKTIHIVELVALLHHKFVFIHPFFDGNGRTARLLMNLFLLQEGFPLVIILKNDRKKYYQVLQKADKGDYKPLTLFIAQAVERSLDIYLKTLLPDHKKDEKKKYYLLSEIAEKTKYSSKYLNLLIRGGKLEAIKEKRNWMTTMEAIEKYMTKRKRKIRS
ncbi:MAG: Fic family protein [Candidatus Peregrinibacteria bacterium]